MPQDWWEGECEGRTGLFPSNYVEKISSAGSAGAGGEGSSGGDDGSLGGGGGGGGGGGKQSSDAPALAKVLYEFESEAEGDLSLHKDEVIQVIDKASQGGWWLGKRENGDCGQFPRCHAR